MKNIIYDVLVGAIILVALVSILPFISASNTFFQSSALRKSETALLEEDDDVVRQISEGNPLPDTVYNVADILALIDLYAQDSTVQIYWKDSHGSVRSDFSSFRNAPNSTDLYVVQKTIPSDENHETKIKYIFERKV